MVERIYFVTLDAEDTLDDLMVECDNIIVNTEYAEMNTLKAEITTDEDNVDYVAERLAEYIVEQGNKYVR